MGKTKLKDTYFGHEGMSKIARTLRYLKTNGIASNGELARISPRYGAHIFDLRKEGWLIQTITVDVNTGHYKYLFKGHESDRKSNFLAKRFKNIR
jgi:hypothetical protein